MAGTGANIPQAIKALREAGWTVRELAADLDLHRSTIYRWAAGTRRPNAANFTALVEHVDAKYGQAIHGRILASAVHLEAAAEALKTSEQRDGREVTAERLAADQAAAEQRRQAAEAEKHAEVRELVNRERLGQHDRIAAAVAAAQQPPSVTYQVDDPFDVVTQPAEMRALEGWAA